MSNRLKIIIAVVLAVGLTFAQKFFDSTTEASDDIVLNNSDAIVKQNVTSFSITPKDITRIYYKGQLIGVLKDKSGIDRIIEKGYKDYYEEDFNDVSIVLNNEIYIVDDKSFANYEDKDEEILDYIYQNDLFAIEAVKINIGDKDVFYVRNKEEFQNALEKFVLNFIDSDTYYRLKNDITIENLSEYGEKNMNVYLEETIVATDTMASASQILKNENDIFMHLCYGNDYNLKYYTVKQYDTVDGVATKTGLSVEQLIAINEKLVSSDQALATGEQLNITPFKSSLTVVVERQRLDKEVVYQPVTEYIKDSSLSRKEYIVDVQGKDGSQDAWYTDIYVNGVMTGYRQDKVEITDPAVQRVVRVGADVTTVDSTGKRFRLPVDYPAITCKYWCYEKHTGVDIVDYHNRYGNIYACADGVITKNEYADDRGFYYFINHGDGFVFEYCHMYEKGWFPVGTKVYQGQPIGKIGSTGNSTGPHVHISIWHNGVRGDVDPCTFIPCQDARNGHRLGYY